jgi:sporulation protein YlmC with PRC-barrel domain
MAPASPVLDDAVDAPRREAAFSAGPTWPAWIRTKEQAMRLDLGTSVRTTDEVFGELADVVIDPIASRVTHLVVQPAHGDGVARLVPIGLVENDENGSKEIRLRCSAEEVTELEHVQEFAFLRLGQRPTADTDWDVGIEDVLALPYYEGSTVMGYGGELSESGISYDRIPKGDVEIRRSSTVAATDADFLGKVDGFVVDDGQITHFVLERGHLWGKREITIPIGTVAKVESDAITLSLSKSQVEDLPSVRVHRWS